MTVEKDITANITVSQIGWAMILVTTVMKVEKDITANITVSQIGWAMILVII